MKTPSFMSRLIRRFFPHEHFWETTHTNGFGHPSQQFCRGCGRYRHKVYRASRLPQWPGWKKGKHPAIKGCGFYSSNNQTTDIMDPTLKPKTEPKPSEEIREKILVIVDEKHGAFWGEFYDSLIPEYPVSEVSDALNSLVRDGTLRMKEDESEHDWEYRRSTT